MRFLHVYDTYICDMYVCDVCVILLYIYIKITIELNSPHSHHARFDWLYLTEIGDCFAEDFVPTKDDLPLSAKNKIYYIK